MTAQSSEAHEWRRVLREWNEIQGPFFQVRECDILWNLKRQDLVTYLYTQLANTPVLYAVTSPIGSQAGLSTKSLWLSLWGKIPQGRESDFVRELLGLAESMQKTRCSLGGDDFHFLPGVPLNSIPSNAALVEALKLADFRIIEECDLVGDIENEAVSSYIANALDEAEKRAWKFAPADSLQEQRDLLLFLSTEFPGRWTREYEFHMKHPDSGRARWAALRDDHHTVIGFARTAVRKNQLPIVEGWTPAALRLPLSADPSSAWCAEDGCLGPIGIANSQRGRGAGRVLLGLVLKSLRENGAKRTCIDWTDALKYYEPLRFDVVRRYGSAWRVANT